MPTKLSFSVVQWKVKSDKLRRCTRPCQDNNHARETSLINDHAREDVFSLGVVMLYLLRRIPLPDKGRGWNVNAVQQHAPEATAPMRAWLADIRRWRDELNGAGASSKETQIRSLVRRMLLLDEEARIRAFDLASQTVEWAV